MKITDSFEVLVNPWLSLNAIVAHLYRLAVLALIDYPAATRAAKVATSACSPTEAAAVPPLFADVAKARPDARPPRPAQRARPRRKLTIAEYEETSRPTTPPTPTTANTCRRRAELSGDLFYRYAQPSASTTLDGWTGLSFSYAGPWAACP
jgi:hypothetical protein